MLKYLTRGLKKTSSQLQQDETSRQHILDRLEHLTNNKCRLLIKASNYQQVFQSMILSIDSLNQTLLIDELFPAPAFELTNEDQVYCEFQEKGCITSFSSGVITKTEISGLPALLIKHPQTVEHEQRRNNFRQTIAAHQPIAAKLISGNNSNLSGYVKDISNQGLRINVQGNHSEELNQGDVLNHCKIKLDGINQIECQLTIRSKHYMHRPYRHTQLGAEITDINLKQRNLITNYVTQQQRAQCRLRADNHT